VPPKQIKRKITMLSFRRKIEQTPVDHACNPSYPGGRDLEDCSLKPGLADSGKDPIWKIPNTKKSDGVA
jgi:hypothetical protein